MTLSKVLCPRRQQAAMYWHYVLALNVIREQG